MQWFAVGLVRQSGRVFLHPFLASRVKLAPAASCEDISADSPDAPQVGPGYSRNTEKKIHIGWKHWSFQKLTACLALG